VTGDNDLRELYQEIILDHNKHPRNCSAMPGATRCAEGYNPLCGDQVKIFLKLQGGVVQDVSFQGSGCAISTASASLMTEILKGKTEAEANAIFERFHRIVTGVGNEDPLELGKLAVFSGVCEYPSRVKCATLAWHTVQAALDDEQDDAAVSTE
jgi:nitrogen fixation NifU-like protein